MITREEILKPMTRRVARVELPDGRECFIRNLNEKEKSDYESSVLTAKGELNKSRLNDARRRLIILCLCDESGEPLLSDVDNEALKAVDGAVTSAIHDECRKHAGFDEGDLEELVGNSDASRAAS